MAFLQWQDGSGGWTEEGRHICRHALLNYYAERVGGAAFLRKAARRVANRGCALLVKPRALIWQSEVGRAMELLAEFARSEASDGRLPLIDRSTPGLLFPEPSLERR